VFLTDNETKVDLLNNEAIAATIIQMLRDQPDHPVTIGVHGDWGAGKSSILEMIEEGLAGDQGVLCLKLNGWRFQGFEDAKIALIEGIVIGLLDKRPALVKAAETVKDVLQRIDWLKVAKSAGSLAMTAFTGVPTPDQVHSVIGTLEGVFADPAKLASKVDIEAAIDGVRSLIRPCGESKKIPREIGAFRQAFDSLLDKAEVKQLVVLLDDLDRCLPDTAIETLEAIRLFVFTRRTAFVVAADEAMIEYAARKHFPDLPDTTGPRDYARNYLEKLIQVPFRIPALGETETRIYVTLLLVGAELGEEDPQYAALIKAARDRLTRPWEGAVLDPATVKGALGDKASGVQEALTLSDQIGPILASGTQGNPRQIKRFLNSLLLRKQTADARGFGEAVKLPVLAKLMLAERFLPRSFFDQLARIAASHPKGLCEHIAAIGAADEERPQRTDAKQPAKVEAASALGSKAPVEREEVSGTTENLVLTEWLASQPIRTWARLKPELAGVDLRPYLFVTRDRKDYFGPVSVLGHLASIVERLLGPKLAVQTIESHLRQLAAPEVAEVFEALRGRIMGSDAFDTEPPGIAGLTVLVRAHPALQPNLLDFLEGLPRDRCGAWVASGWEGAIRDPETSARFDRLLEAWSQTTKNEILRAVAGAAFKTRRRQR